MLSKINTISRLTRVFSNSIKTSSFRFQPLSTINDHDINTIKKVNIEEKKLKYSHLENIDRNEGLRNYMKNIYKSSGFGFGTTLVVGSTLPLALYFAPALTTVAIPLYIGNVCFGFYSIFKITKMRSSTQEYKNGKEIHYKEIIPENKKLWYNLFSISNGITISPLLGAAHLLSPVILPTAVVGTLGIFAGSSLYALNKKDFNAASWQAPLMGCVTGLIGASLVQIGFGLAGNYQIFSMMDMGITGVSLLTFTGLVAADTQNAIKSYGDKQLDSINSSLELLLDATNLLIDMIKIISEIMKNAKD